MADYYESLPRVGLAVTDYRRGNTTFDDAFHTVYEAAEMYGDDPDMIETLDRIIGGITVTSVVGQLRRGLLMVRGTTEYSPTNNFGNTEPDVTLWIRTHRSLLNVGGIIQEPLQSGCRPVPKNVLAHTMLSAYEHNEVSFGSALRAVHQVREDDTFSVEEWEDIAETAAATLGDVEIHERVRGMLGGGDDIAVYSPQAVLCKQEDEDEVYPDVRLYFRRTFRALRPKPGRILPALDDALAPHPRPRYDHYGHLERAARIRRRQQEQ